MTSKTDPNSAKAVVAPKKTSYRSLLQNPGGFRFMVGDIIHFDAQLPRPETTVIFDVDPDGALKNRAAYFKKWASEKTLLASPHLNFPGVGHLKTDGAGYRWLPLYYTNRSFE